jgi:hypothetical protein
VRYLTAPRALLRNGKSCLASTIGYYTTISFSGIGQTFRRSGCSPADITLCTWKSELDLDVGTSFLRGCTQKLLEYSPNEHKRCCRFINISRFLAQVHPRLVAYCRRRLKAYGSYHPPICETNMLSAVIERRLNTNIRSISCLCLLLGGVGIRSSAATSLGPAL